MSLLRPAALSELNSKVAVLNLLSTKMASARKQRRQIEKLVVANRQIGHLKSTCYNLAVERSSVALSLCVVLDRVQL